MQRAVVALLLQLELHRDSRRLPMPTQQRMVDRAVVPLPETLLAQLEWAVLPSWADVQEIHLEPVRPVARPWVVRVQ